MDDLDMNRALREYRKNKIVVRDGEPLDAVNQRLREQADGVRVDLDKPAPRKKATNEQVSDALRRLARGG